MAIPSFDMNTMLARQLGVDWIKVSGDRWMRGEPDLVTEDSEKRVENFWCPEVRWAVGGKEYAAAIPVKTKVRTWKTYRGFDIFHPHFHHAHEMDQAAMLNDLASLIKTTVNN